MSGLDSESRAGAMGTFSGAHETLNPGANSRGSGLSEATLKVFYNTFPGAIVLTLEGFGLVQHLDFVAIGPVDNGVLRRFGEVFPGLGKTEIVMARQTFQNGSVPGTSWLFAQGNNSALTQGFTLIRDDQIFINGCFRTQSIALTARTKGTIKRK